MGHECHKFHDFLTSRADVDTLRSYDFDALSNILSLGRSALEVKNRDLCDIDDTVAI